MINNHIHKDHSYKVENSGFSSSMKYGVGKMPFKTELVMYLRNP